MRWRVITLCPDVHPEAGVPCEGEAGHSGLHHFSVWEDAGDGAWPAYAVWWGPGTSRPPRPIAKA